MRAEIRIYVLNLDRSRDRLASIERQLRQLGLPFTRIAAVDGRSGAIEAELAAGRATLCEKGSNALTREEIGCHLSHIKAFDHILAQNVDAAIILEDDVLLTRNFATAATALLELWHAKPVVVKLEPWKKPRLGVQAISVREFDLVFARHPLTETGAYFITAPAIRALRAPLTRISRSFDDALYAEHGAGVDLFTLNPPVAVQANAFESLIETGRRRSRRQNREHMLKREVLRPVRQLQEFLRLLLAVGKKYGWSGLLSLRLQTIAWQGAKPQSSQRKRNQDKSRSLTPYSGVAR